MLNSDLKHEINRFQTVILKIGLTLDWREIYLSPHLAATDTLFSSY